MININKIPNKETDNLFSEVLQGLKINELPKRSYYKEAMKEIGVEVYWNQ